MKRIVFLSVVVLACLAQGEAQNVTARAHVDSTHYLVGDWIAVRIELKHPSGTNFQHVVGDTLGEFSVISREPLERISDTVTAGGFVVSYFDSGAVVLPPIQFLYALPGDTASRFVATNQVSLAISTVAVDTSQAIRDIKPPLSIPWTLAEIALIATIILVVIAALYYAYRYLKKRQERKPVAPAYVPPPKAPHVMALERLGALKEKKLWQQGLIKEYYSEATDIVREYIEGRFKVRALEQTTDEILGSLRMYQMNHEAAPMLERMLRGADLVKFAKFQPTIPEHEELMKLAYSFVEKTRPSPSRLASAEQRKVASHVA